MKHLECFDVHELVLDKARVFIRSSVYTFFIRTDLSLKISGKRSFILLRSC